MPHLDRGYLVTCQPQILEGGKNRQAGANCSLEIGTAKQGGIFEPIDMSTRLLVSNRHIMPRILHAIGPRHN